MRRRILRTDGGLWSREFWRLVDETCSARAVVSHFFERRAIADMIKRFTYVLGRFICVCLWIIPFLFIPPLCLGLIFGTSESILRFCGITTPSVLERSAPEVFFLTGVISGSVGLLLGISGRLPGTRKRSNEDNSKGDAR